MVRNRRSGYTLFELGLVMAVLVIVGAVSIPVLMPMLTSNHLQAASDLVRSRWTEMRNRAVADGRAYRFSIAENTGKFRIAPEDVDSASSAGSSSEARPWVIEEALPGNVLFLTGQSGPVSDHGQAQGSSGGWTRVLTFLPGGTAREDVQVAFGQAGSRSLILKLKGATGAITSEEPKGHGT